MLKERQADREPVVHSPHCSIQIPVFMSRELLILRHAKSDWDADANSDFERPLAKRGKKDAPRIGAWLYREGAVPDLVISSPAERARQTAVKVCKSMDYKKKHIRWEKQLYGADLSRLLRVLASCPPTAQTILLVGHNPGLEHLVHHLAGDELEDPVDGKLLPTATLARLEMPDDWTTLDPGCAQLTNLTRPRNLD
jgi:phosphohistidine phosphatase